MNTIKIYNPGTPEHDRLTKAAEIMTARSPRGYKYRVGVTYFDYGQGWEWTTILCDAAGDNLGGYQALNPREHEEILTGDIEAAVASVFADKYCPDRIKDEYQERIDERNRAAVEGLVQVYGPTGKGR